MNINISRLFFGNTPIPTFSSQGGSSFLHAGIILCALLILLPLPAHAQTSRIDTNVGGARKNDIPFDPGQHMEEIAQVEAYLNNMTTLKSRFSQTTPRNGIISRGTFYIKRPGKIRWEYVHPGNSLVIINNDSLVFNDIDLDQVTYSNVESAFTTLLNQTHISLTDGPLQVVDIQKTTDMLLLTLSQKKPVEEGEIPETVTLAFKRKPFELSRIYRTSGNNENVSIYLLNPTFGNKLDDDLFTFREKSPKKKRRAKNL